MTNQVPTDAEKTASDPPAGTEAADRFDMLLEESRKFCEAVGLHRDLVLDILRSDSDWTFILKVDALLETAAKQIIRRSLKLHVLDRIITNDALENFVDSLPIRGRTSILRLLDAAGCPTEEQGFIDAARRVRNEYAHNIRHADSTLIEIIKRRGDKTYLLKNLSAIETYNEENLIASYEKDGGFLRFGIIDSALRFLFFAYHIGVK